MNDFLNEILTLKWWLGVALVSIILNILSSYIQSWIDKILSKFSESVRKKSEDKKIEREKQIDFLIKNPSEKYFLALDEIRYRIRSFTFLFLGFVLIYFSHQLLFNIATQLRGNRIEVITIITVSVIITLAGIITFLIALQEQRIAMKKSSLLNEIRSKLD